MMNDKQLTAYAKKLCLKLFGIKYDSYVKFESSTTTTVGRFRSLLVKNMWGEVLKRTHHYHIEILKPFIRRHPDMLKQVLGHELCHYYCYVTNKPFTDYNDYFQSQLKKHHLIAKMDMHDNPKRYAIYCPKCHMVYLFKTRIRANYICNDDKTPMKRYGFVKLHGCYNAKDTHFTIIKIVKKAISSQKPVNQFNVMQYKKANQSTVKGQQMALFA